MIRATSVDRASVSQDTFAVEVGYDAEERVYFVLVSDIPGLNIEVSPFETFVEAVLDVTPELVDQRGMRPAIEFRQMVQLTAL